MTKPRHPLSEHHAVKLVIDHLGLAEAARHVRRHARTVSSWSDVDRTENIPLKAALLLDKAYLAAGGNHPPIGCVYMAELRAHAAAAYFGAMGRAELAARAALEGGEATAACLYAYAGEARLGSLLEAERETEEAIVAYAATLHDIRRQLGAHGIERTW